MNELWSHVLIEHCFAQTRSALLRIFSDLAEDDFFGLITFDGSVSHWKRELVQATTENVDSARKFAQGIGPQGGRVLV